MLKMVRTGLFMLALGVLMLSGCQDPTINTAAETDDTSAILENALTHPFTATGMP